MCLLSDVVNGIRLALQVSDGGGADGGAPVSQPVAANMAFTYGFIALAVVCSVNLVVIVGFILVYVSRRRSEQLSSAPAAARGDDVDALTDDGDDDEDDGRSRKSDLGTDITLDTIARISDCQPHSLSSA